ncbi:glycosyl hydrolase family 18 protein [Oligoflexus tunisiensis]|uniref:glycosyl hydrolase family 18 protein n=1 Tax=Oligoflexus tunisiensis TaxID=708132 RepID=UPI000A73B468|nr:glycoside hydrolase family 18 protein [Oligoflexus tunisiensis]
MSCFSLRVPIAILLASGLWSCSDKSNTSQVSSILSPVECAKFTPSYNANSRIASLKLVNDCGRSLDFSEAKLRFSGAKPETQPWGRNPDYFSWINWQLDADGFSYSRDPAATWLNVSLNAGDELNFEFTADAEPSQPRLYLGVGTVPETPAPAPGPAPEPNPEPNPEPTQPPVTPDPEPAPLPQPVPGGQEIVAYYQSWSAGWASEGSNLSLAKLPPYITTVLLSFVRPETSYQAGQQSWVGTGMDFSSDFKVVKDAIKVLKTKNPGTKVLLSIGGATYVNWKQANAQAVAALVRDLGADGADLDYEPTEGVCSWGSGGTSCPGDQEFIQIIRTFRRALPRPYLITTAAWSTGAFGTAKYPASSFNGNLIGSNFGLYVNPLKAAGTDFDAIYIMSYDAGGPNAPAGTPTGYDPKKAFQAYRELYKGPLMLGVEIPPEAWGGHVSTPAEAAERASYVRSQGGNGMMIWSLQKAGNPSATDFVQAMCRTLGLSACDRPLP